MKHLVKSSAMVLGVLMGIAACDDSSNKNPIENVREATQDKDLQSKVYRGECNIEVVDAIASFLATGGKVAIKSSRDQYQFVGANVTHTTSLYESANCEGQEVLVFKETGSFNTHPDQRAEDQSKMIDIKYDKLTLAAGNAEGEKAATELKMCGFEDWAGGKEQDVTGQASKANCYGKTLPVSEFNVYRIDNNNLFFGKPGQSLEARPSRSDMSRKYSAE